MKKIALLLVLCFLTLVVVSGCVQEDVSPAEVAELVQKDISKNSKIKFEILNKELHEEFKNNGSYDNSKWTESALRIAIKWNRVDVQKADWYARYGRGDVNRGIVDNCCVGIAPHEIVYANNTNVLFLTYFQLRSFCKDYETIKALENLEYVEQICIYYLYGLPYDWVIM